MNQQVSLKFLTSCFTFLFGLAVCLSSCEDPGKLAEPVIPSEAGKAKTANGLGIKTFYGPATPLGQGVARAWVATDKQGNLLSVGVKISEHAVESLVEKGGEEHEAFLLQLPKQGESTLYDHVVLDWNPHGHPPIGTYTLPHFDLHFYMISEEERASIPAMPPFSEDGQLQFDELPAPAYVPEDYVPDPGIVPNMGVHWSDTEAPEHHGETFTRTFIYGSYNGAFIFHEPMFTVAYLQDLKQREQPFESIEIKQPDSYQMAGYYPMEYSFTYKPTPGEYIISLDKLVLQP